MQPPFNGDSREIAEGMMGISLYQRFSPSEDALFLKISLTELRKPMKRGMVNSIEVGSDKSDFFGYQLLEYLLSAVTNNNPVEYGKQGRVSTPCQPGWEFSGLALASEISQWIDERQ